MNCVYILYSERLNRYYVGEASNINERVEQHNSGFYSTAFTKQVSDWTLFHVIDCKDRVQARKIETHIEKMKSRTYIQNLKRYPEILEELKSKYN